MPSYLQEINQERIFKHVGVLHFYSHRHNVCTVTDTICVQSQTQFVYSHRHNVCTVTDAMCVQSQTKCVYSHRHNLCTVTDTMCVQSQKQCVYSHRHNVCTVTDQPTALPLKLCYCTVCCPALHILLVQLPQCTELSDCRHCGRTNLAGIWTTRS